MRVRGNGWSMHTALWGTSTGGGMVGSGIGAETVLHVVSRDLFIYTAPSLHPGLATRTLPVINNVVPSGHNVSAATLVARSQAIMKLMTPVRPSFIAHLHTSAARQEAS